MFNNLIEGIKNLAIDIKDEWDMCHAEPLTEEEQDRYNSAYDWRCIGREDD